MKLAVICAVAVSAPLGVAQRTPKLDTTTFVVMGEGLAAGMGNYGLSEVGQRTSFPALLAGQMKTAFPQPLIEGPGLGDVLGYQSLPPRVPTYPQTRARIFPARPDVYDEKPTLFVFNLSVPGMRLADATTRRPMSPLIQKDMFQTTLNLILGFPQLILEKDVPLWTQLQYAEAMNPSLALVSLGYFEALEAAVAADGRRIPDAANFRTGYTQVVRTLRGLQAQVIVTTIPDPGDTAYFTPVDTALNTLRVNPLVLYAGYGLKPEDVLTRNALSTIGVQLGRKKIEGLPAGSVAPSGALTDIRNRVNALNSEINNIARDHGAIVYDLNAFMRRVKTSGVRAGSRHLTADYMGGFYTLDGYHPGPTGHALIANEILALINRTYGETYPAVDLNPIMAADATLQHRTSDGRTAGTNEVTPAMETKPENQEKEVAIRRHDW